MIRARTSRSVVLLFATAAFLSLPARAGAVAADEIHYTYTGPASVAFDWRGTANDISFGSTASYGTTVTAVTPSPLPFSSPGPFWEAELTGLQPGATYHYSIGGGPDGTFRTAPTGSFRFDVEGDVGSSVFRSTIVPTQQQIASDNPAFVLVSGDLTYADGGAGQPSADAHFNDVMVWSKTAAYMPAWGNHESSAPDDLRNYKGRFKLPNAQTSPGAPVGGGEDWGWFDGGGVRFISLPEPYGRSDWATKADAIMASAQSNSSIHFIVTYGHRPAYSTGFHAGETDLQNILNGLGDKYSKFVLNLNAHSHDYERYVPIHGVVHITAAGGGQALETPWRTSDPLTAFRAMHLEHLRVDVTDTSMKIDAICGPSTSSDGFTCSQGSVIDSLTIGTVPPPPPQTDAAPVARITATPGSGAPTLDVSFNASASTDTDSTPISTYTFDFGDGATVGPQASPTAAHAYTQDGTYVATVTVTDTGGLTGTATTQISVATPAGPPTASLTVSPSSGTVPLSVTADGSASTAGGAAITNYSFDFGDGSPALPGSSPTATHTYAVPGLYTVTLVVTDGNSAQSSATKPVTASALSGPTARLTLSPSSGPAPLNLTASGSGSTPGSAPISTFRFDFGDGSFTAGPTPSAAHTYQDAGTYSVLLTVTDGNGLQSFDTVDASVGAPVGPTASVTVTPSSGTAPLSVTANGSGSRAGSTPISTYRFDFGDGFIAGPQSSSSAIHTYQNPGTYSVTLTVTDARSLTSTATATATVTQPSAQLVGNPGFETDTSGWAVSPSANGLTRVAGGHTGSFAASIKNTGTKNATLTLDDSPNWVTAISAGTYTGTLWVRGTSGGSLKLRLREMQGASSIGSATTSITLSTNWQAITVTYAVKSPGSTQLDLNAYIQSAKSGFTFFADDASITRA